VNPPRSAIVNRDRGIGGSDGGAHQLRNTL
jgi:hypothetical protein